MTYIPTRYAMIRIEVRVPVDLRHDRDVATDIEVAAQEYANETYGRDYNGSEPEPAGNPVTGASLAWYTSESADAENHDQEADLNAIGSPGGASWASVAPDGRAGYKPWLWVVYDRWLNVDEAPSATLAQGGADDEDEAKAAVAAWVASARRADGLDAEEGS